MRTKFSTCVRSGHFWKGEGRDFHCEKRTDFLGSKEEALLTTYSCLLVDPKDRYSDLIVRGAKGKPLFPLNQVILKIYGNVLELIQQTGKVNSESLPFNTIKKDNDINFKFLCKRIDYINPSVCMIFVFNHLKELFT